MLALLNGAFPSNVSNQDMTTVMKPFSKRQFPVPDQWLLKSNEMFARGFLRIRED